ncbi:MAG: GAF domain-containing sensor histidine kinase [Actinomycetota bacterium]|nr:hypothetical protein [Actinomycetota bacterium]
MRFLMPIIPVSLIAIIFIAADRLLPVLRARIDAHRKHPRDGVVFKTFFVLFAAAIIVWLTAGFVPAVVRAAPSLHARLHSGAGNSAPVKLSARNFQFSETYLTIPAHRSATILFRNYDVSIQHNFALYDVDGMADQEYEGLSEDAGPVFSSSAFAGSGTREFSFVAPSPGFYLFQCDVTDEEFGDHNTAMTGWINIVPSGLAPETLKGGVVRDLERGAASAYHYAERPGQVALDYLFSISTLALGIFLVRKRPLDRVARLLGVAMIGTAAAYNIQSHAALDVLPSLAGFIHPLFVHPVSGILYLYALVLFPDGKLVPHFSNRTVHALYRPAVFGAFIIALGVGGLSEPSPGPGHAAAFVALFGLLVPLVGFAAQLYRYRYAHSPELKQQSKVLLWALGPALVFGAAVVLIRQLGGPSGTFQGARLHDLQAFTFRLYQPVFIVIPAAVVVGILRFRLWDLDVVINKAILYGSLAGFIAAAYVAVVVGIGLLLGDTGNPFLSVATLVAVAVAFEPVRERLRGFANKLVYGTRATPYQMMAEFSQSLTQSPSTEDVLPLIAEYGARCVGGARSDVALFLPDGTTRTTSWPARDASGQFERTFPVLHQGEIIGEVAVAKAAGDPWTSADERVLSALTSQAAVALHGARLTAQLEERLKTISSQAADLAESRKRILSARDAERNRLEREIRSSVEQRLLVMQETLSDPAASESIFLPLLDEATDILERLRTISHGVFPSLLADRGLVAALEAQLRKIESGSDVRLESDLPDERFDRGVEASLYFCCVEAVKDTIRRAGRTPITLRLAQNGDRVEFSISGAAVDPALVQEIRDRVEALGGSLTAEKRTLFGSVFAYEPDTFAHAAVSTSGSSIALEM